jgi:ectoine hydroxylase-related dioxygenase (phytanoyl-CoA dioxygenase family)|tara:strand:+ start:2376 stop:3107 length:732 start_codon:yes stop_codon:yes gene_type:complete
MYHSSRRRTLEEKGIVKIPAVFTPQECALMKSNAYSISDQEIKASGYPHVPSEQAYNKKSLIFFPALANDYLNNIRIDMRMSLIVQELIGNNVKQINNQVYFREAGDTDTFAWHRDTIFRESSQFADTVETDYLQTVIAVDAITEDNGAVEFIEGSHLWPEFAPPSDLRKFERGDLSGTKYTANQGDILIWSVKIVHGSEANSSDRPRMTYMNGFCKSESVIDYPTYIINGKVVPHINPERIP